MSIVAAPPLAHLISCLRRALQPVGPGAAELRLTIQVVLAGADGGRLWIDVAGGRVDVGEGLRSSPDLTFELAGADLAGLLEGRLNPDLLVLEDRLRIEGDLSRALELRKLFRSPPRAASATTPAPGGDRPGREGHGVE